MPTFIEAVEGGNTTKAGAWLKDNIITVIPPIHCVAEIMLDQYHAIHRMGTSSTTRLGSGAG